MCERGINYQGTHPPPYPPRVPGKYWVGVSMVTWPGLKREPSADVDNQKADMINLLTTSLNYCLLRTVIKSDTLTSN